MKDTKMKAEINKLPKSQLEITVEMPWQEFQPFVGKAIKVLGKGVEVKGFRPGKAPQEFTEKEIGKDKILEWAADIAVREKYAQVVAEKQIEPIGAPRVEILKLAEGNPFCFKVQFEVLPKIKLPDYKKIASGVEKKEVPVKVEEVEDALKWLQKSKATFEDLKRGAKKGDFIEIEYQSPQIENNKVFKDAFLLGEGRLAPGFEQNLEGVKAGEERKFNIEFPKDYGKKELAGKKAEFKVKMKKAQLMKLPELNDGLAESLGQFKDLEGLKRSVKQGIAKEKGAAEVKRWREEVLERIAKATEFEAPESLVALEQEQLFLGLKNGVEKELKMEFKDYLAENKKKEEEVRQDFFKPAQKRVKNLLLLREIGKQEKVEVADQEIEEYVNRFLTTYPQPDKAKQEIDVDKLKEYYKGIIYNEKVMQLLAKATEHSKH